MSGTTVVFEILTQEEKDAIVRAAIPVAILAGCGAILPTDDADEEAERVLKALECAVQEVEIPR